MQLITISATILRHLERYAAPGARLYPEDRDRTYLKRRLRVTSREVQSGLQRARRIVERTDALLSNGTNYLLGARFTAADLTLACMLAPLVLPRRYGIRLPTIDEVPKAMRETVEEFRSTATGSFVLRLFEVERPEAIRDA